MSHTRLFLIVCFLSVAARAEVISFSSGNNLEDGTRVSVDAGYATGNVNTWGTRLNYRVQPQVLTFGMLGMSSLRTELDPVWHLSYGGGVILTLPEFDLPFRSGLKFSYHRLPTSRRYPIFGRVDQNMNEYTVRYLLSGDVDTEGRLQWFGELGMHWFRTNVHYHEDLPPESRGTTKWDESEIGLEAGLLYNFNENVKGILSLESVNKTFLNLALRYRF